MTQPPNSVDAEERLLSICFQRGDEIAHAIELGVATEHFYLPKHQLLWDTLTELHNANTTLEPGNVMQLLVDRGQGEDVGGPSGLAAVYRAEPLWRELPKRVAAIRGKWILRNSLQFAKDLAEASVRVTDPLEAVTGLLGASTAELEQQLLGPTTTDTIKEHVVEFIDRWKRRKAGEQKDSIPVGIREFDNGPWKGIFRGGITIISARPSSGKTALAVQMINGACSAGLNAAFFSLEMTADQAVDRLITVNGKLEADAVMTDRTATQGDLKGIKSAVDAVAGFDLTIDDSPGQTADYIVAKAKVLHRKKPLDLIVVDYVQIIKGQRQKGDTQEREYAYVSEALQSLAKQTGAAMLLLSQVNEEGTTKGAKAFEEAADLWVHIIRNRGEADDKGIAVQKCRHRGANGDILPLSLVKHKLRFETRER
jgi:replicative DNA helicase